jgi:hypothetical protein
VTGIEIADLCLFYSLLQRGLCPPRLQTFSEAVEERYVPHRERLLVSHAASMADLSQEALVTSNTV